MDLYTKEEMNIVNNIDFINKIYYGDNISLLKDLKKIPNNSIDLIYLDPPFNSNSDYNHIYTLATGHPVPEEAFAFTDAWDLTEEKIRQMQEFGEQLQIENKNLYIVWNTWINALKDTNPKMMSYITFITPRLYELSSKLKPTGSIFVHCDGTASHYIKIMLDGIFGHQNFRNDIIWKRTNNPKGSQHRSKKFGVYTDNILFYSKSDKNYLDIDGIKTQLIEEELEKKYPKKDSIGPYLEYPILRSQSKGERPTLCYEYKGFTPKLWGWVVKRENLEKIDERGDLGWRENGQPFRKYRPWEDRGHPIGNIWDDIPRLSSNSKERMGYPTQKPVALMERIIKAATKEGDIVLDPFCGCGTTIIAAQKLKRKWIGIDICLLAIYGVETRLHQEFIGLKKGKDYEFAGIPMNHHQLKALIEQNNHSKNEGRFEFQYWASEKVGAYPSTKKTGDKGIDAAIYFYKDDKKTLGKMVISVKSGKVDRRDLSDIIQVMKREKGDMAGFISFEKPSKDMYLMAQEEGAFQVEDNLYDKYQKVQILLANEILEGKQFKIPNMIHPNAKNKYKN